MRARFIAPLQNRGRTIYGAAFRFDQLLFDRRAILGDLPVSFKTLVVLCSQIERKIAMIIGAHSIIYSRKPEADRSFLRNVLKLPNIDVGDGWLIFGLPPSEVAVHPSNKNDVHEFYLMCE